MAATWWRRGGAVVMWCRWVAPWLRQRGGAVVMWWRRDDVVAPTWWRSGDVVAPGGVVAQWHHGCAAEEARSRYGNTRQQLAKERGGDVVLSGAPGRPSEFKL